MTAIPIKVFATPDAYEILKDSDDQQTFQIMKAVKTMVLNNDLSHTGYGFGNCPIMLVSRESSAPDGTSVILLYKGKADNDPIKLWNETMAIRRNMDHYLETAVPLSFDV
ncbi:MAG TPA: hypothetical protein VFA15_08925 [Nitrososphaera sp.]|nr:hypothetical protein [Nitrososphaera sp.]